MQNLEISVRKCADYSTWGKVSVSAMNRAVETLSPEAFRLWVRLSVNQDGFSFSFGKVENAAADELVALGYLVPTGMGRMVFCDAPCNGDEHWKIAWKCVFSLYGDAELNESAELRSVQAKLEEASLTDQMESILWYWSAWAEELQKVRKASGKAIRNPLRYDCAVAITWWLWDHWEFEIGDVIPLRDLRSFDKSLSAKVEEMLKNGKERIALKETNLDEWNHAFSFRKVSLPLSTVGAIIFDRIALGNAA